MREVVLDTETTGLDPKNGHRIVEIGAVEVLNYVPTGREFHTYINPERAMPAEAFAVHGLGDDFLSRQPVFADILEAFLDFIGSDPLVIHNAPFDAAFLNAELARLAKSPLDPARIIDTIPLARARFPGARVNLDALCQRFGISLDQRSKHGALIDATLLARVYLELRGGRQPDFTLSTTQTPPLPDPDMAEPDTQPVGSLYYQLSATEAEAHSIYAQRFSSWQRFRGVA